MNWPGENHVDKSILRFIFGSRARDVPNGHGKRRSQGKLKSAVQAAEWIFGELARTPMEFGESRDEYPSLDLHVRLAIIGPLAVQFAVNVEQKMVFLLWFRLRAN